MTETKGEEFRERSDLGMEGVKVECAGAERREEMSKRKKKNERHRQTSRSYG